MRKVRWGVIGAGGIADRRTIPALLNAPSCELSALMDIARTAELEQKYGVPCYRSETELLAHPGLDAVYIATPVYLHKDQIRCVAQAGKHVLVEKPLCRTASEAQEAIRDCRKSGVLLQEGYMMRFHGGHRKVHDLIGSGAIGSPVYARAQLACWYPRIGGAWRQNPELGGGGALIDMATHLYDLLEMLLGPIARVGVLTGTQVQDYPVEDSATTLLQFASGCHATTDTFYCVPDNASLTRLEIYGDRGSILAEGTIGQGSGGTVMIHREASAKGYEAGQAKEAVAAFESVEFEKVNPYTAECESFSQSILQGRQEVEVNNGEHGLHILRVVAAAYESARSGRLVELP